MKKAAQYFLALEPFALAVILVAFWTPNLDRVHTLWLIVPFLAARVIAYRRLIPSSRLTPVLIVLLAMAMINLFAAPYSWGTWILGRPLMGVIVATSFADWGRRWGAPAFNRMLLATALLGLLIGVVALFWSQWVIESKSAALQPIIDAIPPAPTGALIETFIGGGFNPNEIAGGMSWMLPLVAVIALLDWQQGKNSVRKWVATFAFIALSLAIFLGQSRAGIAGVLVALAGISVLLIRPGWTRRIWWIALAVVTAFEGAIVTGMLNPEPEALMERDEGSVNSRLLIWQAGIDMVIDYPLTGVGMNKYRAAEVRALYPVIGYERFVLPHAHNEFLQVSTDLGLPGLAVFSALYGAVFWILYRCWRSGIRIAVGIAAGLTAHLIFGMVDAVTLFDRFIFVFWWLIGLALIGEQFSQRFIEDGLQKR